MSDVVVTGAAGQLGNALRACQPDCLEVAYVDGRKVDLTDRPAVEGYLERERPKLVINCAAYTNVDMAEEEPEAAFLINAKAIRDLALASCAVRARLLHISTDFVFAGDKNRPYTEEDTVGPLSVYGKSKLAGERALNEVSNLSWIIVRTSWLYGLKGNNFVKTMLRLMDERDELSVVDDQVGSPTFAGGLASRLWGIVTSQAIADGIYHYCDSGEISWHQFALAIQAEAMKIGLLKRTIPVHRIAAIDYPAKAKRPAYSVLDSSKLTEALKRTPDPWRANLVLMLGQLKDELDTTATG